MSGCDSENEMQENDSEDSIASDVLTNVLIVLVKIFKLLSARDLNSCARVCSLWRDRAKCEKDSRKKMSLNYFTFENCNSDLWKDKVQHYIKDLPFEPACIMMFCTVTLWDQIVVHGPGRKRKKKNALSAKDLICPCLPKQCVFQATVTDGIVGTDLMGNTTEIEDYTPAVAILALGHFPGVEFASFSIAHVEWSNLTTYWNGNSARKPACLKSLANKDVKMFNIFGPMSGLDTEVGYALFKMFGWPLVAGGFVNERCLRDSQGVFHSSNPCIISGLAICGAEVQVASVLLRSHIQTDEELNRVVRNLTDYNFPHEKSFGLMYACLGRGQHLYERPNVESTVFRKYFPNTPLIGFFGNGEIGCTFPQPGLMPVPKKPKPDPKFVNGEESLSAAQMKRHLSELSEKLDRYRYKHVPKILHSYTTVLCLVALP